MRGLAKEHTGVRLIQEPWVTKGGIRGLSGEGVKIFRDPSQPMPRACIAAKGIEAVLMPSFCSRDLAVIKARLPVGDGLIREIVVASGYFPGDSEDPPPPEEVQTLVEHCDGAGLPLLLGCDANSHHVTWGSTDTNARGEALLQYLATTNLNISNRGNEPTFWTSVRREVIDLTLNSFEISRHICDWRVSDEPSLSDHRYIVFR